MTSPRWGGLALLVLISSAGRGEVVDGYLTSAAGCGATVPWTRYEAEAGRLSGGATITPPSRERGTFAAESSGRQCVQLQARGDGVTFTLHAAAQAIVLRYAMPDAPTGGGRDDRLRVTAGGRDLSVPITSRHAWQYGDEAVNNGVFSNTPPSPGYVGPLARLRFDDARFTLSAPLPAGATVTIAMGAETASAWLYLDLVETEPLPPPVARPTGYLDATDPAYGAVPGGDQDNLPPLAACVAAAKAARTGVYLPPGTYRLSGPLPLSAVTLQGAGQWHTTLRYALPNGQPPKYTGLHGGGGRVRVLDLMLESTATSRDDTRAFTGWYGPGSEFRRVWVEHVGAGAWIADYDPAHQEVTEGLLVAECRFRNTYADGINLCVGTRLSTVEQCHLRNNLDDAVACWSAKRNQMPPTRQNVFRANTIENTLRGAGIGIFGGSGHRIADNLVTDSLADGGLRFAGTFPGHPFDDQTPMLIEQNAFVRCGGLAYQRPMGAVGLIGDAAMGPVRNLRFQRNLVEDPTYSGVLVETYARQRQPMVEVYFQNTFIKGTGNCGLYATERALGWLAEEGTRLQLSDPAATARRGPRGFEFRAGRPQ